MAEASLQQWFRTTSAADGFAEAQIKVEDSATGATLGPTCLDTSNDCANTTGEMVVHVQPGQLLEVVMSGFVHTGEFASPASVYAEADPLFFVDPSFQGADQYSIQLSDGVANALPAAREPGTLVLLTGAMAAALGWFMCRRRWKAPVIPVRNAGPQG